jgi:hypothetical protein
MSLSKNASLVLNAEHARARRQPLTEALSKAQRGFALESFSEPEQVYGPWTRELAYVNQHITVSQEHIESAVRAYKKVAHYLVEELDWPDDAITVLPQGSASTQTLIRSPDASKFDIDAVCQVDISQVDAYDPVGFFNKVGEALREFEAIAKKRCWNIPFTGERFYLEFTPSVPLATVPQTTLESMSPRFFVRGIEYLDTALAVVDTPTEQWKTSNPAGFAKWVNDIAMLRLIRQIALESASFRESASVAPVPAQDVEITDTLRVAIRLFKRHRDMCVRRNVIDREFQPISVIIVTLLTTCYAGLSELGRTYFHPVELLVDLVDLMPGMVRTENGKYYVDNPTVPGENFAERWNQDNGERYEAFTTWCDILLADLRTILETQDELEIQRRVRDIFGCRPNTSSPIGSGGTPPAHRPPPAVKRTSGLA